MSRIQLAINVDDIDRAVDFYRTVFATEPAKVREGYANFAVADPPMKLVLIQNPDAAGTVNHLGVEVETTAQVTAFAERVAAEGIDATDVANTECCFAEQDKTYVRDADALEWEVYTVLADAPGAVLTTAGASVCCAPAAGEADAAPSSTGCC